jgi:predicted methyltransferase
MKRFPALLLLSALAFVAACRTTPPPQPEASVKPGVNAEFLKPGLDPAQWVERFEKEGREVYDQREAIVKLVGARPGMSVADIGAGTGMFTALLAREVGPRGTVYAVDIVPEFVKLVGDRAKEAGLNQIRPVQCTDRSVELPPGSVDVAFICDTYHHFEFPRSTMTSLHRALKPGGEVLLVDFKRIPGESSEWTLNHVRAGQEVFEREIEAAGFARIGESDLLKQNYIVRFQKIDR